MQCDAHVSSPASEISSRSVFRLMNLHAVHAALHESWLCSSCTGSVMPFDDGMRQYLATSDANPRAIQALRCSFVRIFLVGHSWLLSFAQGNKSQCQGPWVKRLCLWKYACHERHA